MAKVESIHVSEGSMRPMLSKRSVKLIPGVGVEGDRYATGQGTYEAFKEPGRQLTVISGDSAEASICGLPRRPAGGVGDLRRNVVVTGMTAAALNDSVGHNLKLGNCVVLVHRRCVPCMYNERLNSSPGLMEAAWEAGGVNCEILRGGDLSVGDAVQAEVGSYRDGRANDGKGGQSGGEIGLRALVVFVPHPSRRGVAMKQHFAYSAPSSTTLTPQRQNTTQIKHARREYVSVIKVAHLR